MNKMKKIVITIAMVSMMTLGLHMSNTYTREVVVDSIENNIVTFIDTTGNMWEWEAREDENYKEGQEVKLIMNNMDTTDITDDTIVKIK